jgi:UDP-GlcNAc:undecaprenyl-phosphate GlcNAc-1-phosphate transferase
LLILSPHTPWFWLAPLLIAGALGLLATPIVRWLAIRFDVLDWPVGQKIHKHPTPLLGGVAVYAAFAMATMLFLPIGGPVLGILAGGAAAVTVGILDDRLRLSPLVHLAGQTLAATVTVVAGVGIVRNVSDPFAAANYQGSWHLPVVLGAAFTLFWIVGMMNTVNFLDGLDGLSAGVGTIAALLLAVWAAQPQRYIAHPSAVFHHAELILPLILAGGLLGFLPYNWHPARIFIGDAGALFIGQALAALSILGPAKIGTALLILIIPVLDVAWAIVRRQLRGRSFLTGDKQHVYHRMLELGMSHLATVISLYALCIVLGMLDLVLVKLQKLIAFAVLGLLAAAAFVALEVAGNRREAAAQRHKPAPRTG